MNIFGWTLKRGNKDEEVNEASIIEIRKAFHDILNQFHKITMTAGAVSEMIKMEKAESLSPDKLKEKLKEAREALAEIENFGEGSGAVVEELKAKVYGTLKIDASKPVEPRK